MSDEPVDGHRAGPSLGDLALALRVTWLPVLVFVAVASGAGYVLGTTGDTTYAATTTVAVADARTQTGVFGQPVPGAAIGREEAELLASSNAVRLRVAERLGLPAESIAPIDTAVSEDRDDPFIDLTAHADRRDRALDLSNAFAAALVDERRARLGAELDQLVGTLRAEVDARRQEIAAIDAELAAPGASAEAEVSDRRRAVADALAALRTRLAELEVEARAASGGVTIADPAVVASEVPRPQPSHLAVLGALVAAVLAVAIIYLRLSYEVARASVRRSAGRVIDLDATAEHRVGVTS